MYIELYGYNVITARKRSLGQGNIFTPVCHSVHRGGMCGCSQGRHVWLLWGGHAWLSWGGMCGCLGGMRGFIRGACMVLFGGACMVLFRGGMCGFIQGVCMVLFGGRAWFYSGGASVVFSVFSNTMRYGQWAGGTHPTGMHSCYYYYDHYMTKFPCIISPYVIINTDTRVRLIQCIVVVALHSSYYDDVSICVSCWWQMISSPEAPAQQ